MKKVSFLISLFLLVGTLGMAQVGPQLTFEVTDIDLGEVKKGEKRTGSFDFVNTGEESIEIDIVSACECTTLEWTQGPIAPGKQGKVHFIFDSTEKEASETIDVDINLKNIDPITGGPKLIIVSYKFELIQ